MCYQTNDSFFSTGHKFSFPLDIPQKLKEWSENYPNEQFLNNSQLLASLQEDLDKYFSNFNKIQENEFSPEDHSMTALQELLASISSMCTSPELAAAIYADYNRLTEICGNSSGYNSFMPLCVSPTTKKGLIYCLKKFVPPDENLRDLSESELHEIYLTYTPTKSVTPRRHKASPPGCGVCLQDKSIRVKCYHCGSGQCSECPMSALSFPQLHITDRHTFCSTCVELLQQECTNLWMEKAASLIQNGSIPAVLRCMTMAVYAGGSCDTQMLECLKAMYKKGHSLAALPMMVSLIQTCTIPNLLVQAHYYLAKMLQYIARENCVENGKDHLFFLSAAAIAFTRESICSDQTQSSIDLSLLPQLQHEIESSLEQRQVSLLSTYEDFWRANKWEELLDRIGKGKCTSYTDVEGIKVLKKFIAEKQNSDIKEEEERNVLLFLRGKLCIFEGKYSEGVEHIESAIWTYHSPTCLQNDTAALMISILPKCMSLNNPKAVLNASTLLEGSTENISSRIATLVSAETFELEPPLKNMLARSLLDVDHSMRRREKKILTDYQQGALTKKELADEYITLMQFSRDYSENIMCHLLAALWYLQHLHDVPKSSRPERFAIKKIITYLLDQVLLKTRIYDSHPGFQLYAETIALKVIVNILQTNKDILSPKDSELTAQTLFVVLRKARMCPLWDIPISLVSEVDHIDEVAGALHREYLQGLEEVETDLLPIHKAELMYHLYEHDLGKAKGGLQSSYFQKSMEELLHEKNWSYDDVVQRMTSPMDPRDSEGWLVPSAGKLGVQYEYVELKGMVVHLSSILTSIEFVFEPTTPHTPGVISMEDVKSFMQLDLDDVFPLHFSLDPPDTEKMHHPFQDVAVNKKLPRAIQHTLLHTDYLMKSFSVGSDVSSKPPFKQRSCKDGLTKHLPPHLQQATRSISERGEHKSGRSMSRFWIQADKVHYELSQTGSRYEFRFGDVDIRIRSHPIIPSTDGNLQDTAEDLDPDSPEAQFAADLTNNYKELSHYFPEYARLYELGKILAVKYLLHCIELSIKEQHNEDIFNLKPNLSGLLSKFRLPSATTDNSCYWVPAALHEERTSACYSRCYGGVLFAPRMSETSVPKFSSTTHSVPLKPDEEDDSSSSGSGLLRFFNQGELIAPILTSKSSSGLRRAPKVEAPKLRDSVQRPSHHIQRPQPSQTPIKKSQQSHKPIQRSQKPGQPSQQSLKLRQQSQQSLKPGQQSQQSLKPGQQSQQSLKPGQQSQQLQQSQKPGHQPVQSHIPSWQSRQEQFGQQIKAAAHNSPADNLQQTSSKPFVVGIQSTASHQYPRASEHYVHPTSPSYSANPTAVTFACNEVGLTNNSSLSNFISKLREYESSTMDVPFSISKKVSKLVSLLLACILSQGDSSKKLSAITFHPPEPYPCLCMSYRCFVSSLGGELFEDAKGTLYRIICPCFDCEMRDLIYAIVIKGKVLYVGLTTQELWRRIYQHLTKAYKKYIRDGIDREKRSIADELAACFENSSVPVDNMKKKAFMKVMGDVGVKICALAWFSGSPDTPKEEKKKTLAAAESFFINQFGTFEEGANLNRGADIGEHKTDWKNYIRENFTR